MPELRKKKRNALPFTGLILCFSMILLFTGCSAGNSVDTPVEAGIPVEVAVVGKGSITSTLSSTGIVKPLKTAYVAAPAAGYVSDVFFKEGDRVKAGDVLFTLETRELEENIRVLEAQLKSAQAGLALAETGVAAAFGSDYQSRKIQLEFALKSAESQFVAAQTAMNRAVLMREAGTLSLTQYLTVKNQYQQAEYALDTADQSYSLYMDKAALDSQEAARQQYNQAEASCEALSLQIENLKSNREQARITSPIDGIVGMVNVISGGIASNELVPFVILDSDKVEVLLSLTENSLGSLKVGDSLSVSVSSVKEAPFTGVVSRISPAVDEKTLAFPVYIEIDNKEGRLLPGMTAKVELVAENKKNVVIIPLSAVILGDSSSYVFTNENGKAVKKSVTRGITENGNVEILRGLAAGEELIIKGQNYLEDNDPVLITDREGLKP